MPNFSDPLKKFKGFGDAKTAFSRGDKTISQADKKIYKQLADIKNDEERADAIIRTLQESNAKDDASTLSMRWILDKGFIQVLTKFKDANSLSRSIAAILFHNPKDLTDHQVIKAREFSTNADLKKLLAKLTNDSEATNSIVCIVGTPDSTHFIAQTWSQEPQLYGIISKIEDTQKRADSIIAILNNGNEEVCNKWLTESALKQILVGLPQKELVDCLYALIQKGGKEAKAKCQKNAIFNEALENEANNRSFLSLFR